MRRLINSYPVRVEDFNGQNLGVKGQIYDATAEVYEYEATYQAPGYTTTKTVQDLIIRVNGKGYGSECWKPAQ